MRKVLLTTIVAGFAIFLTGPSRAVWAASLTCEGVGTYAYPEGYCEYDFNITNGAIWTLVTKNSSQFSSGIQTATYGGNGPGDTCIFTLNTAESSYGTGPGGVVQTLVWVPVATSGDCDFGFTDLVTLGGSVFSDSSLAEDSPGTGTCIP